MPARIEAKSMKKSKGKRQISKGKNGEPALEYQAFGMILFAF
jgi:hypothetical protein